MEQAQWTELSLVIKAVCRAQRPLPRAVFSHCLIMRLYFWAVLHGRPVSSAIQRLHYNRLFRPRKLPSVSQLNRRIASPLFQQLLQQVHQRLSGADQTPATTLYIDGKALPVSPVSGDRDARWLLHTKGYKLHAIVNDQLKIPMFCVHPINRHEMPIASHMLAEMPPLVPGTRVMADGNYDAHDFHKHVQALGGWLITRPRRGGARRRQGRGHAVTRRQMGPARCMLIDLWEDHAKLMQKIYRERSRIERVFGNLVATPGLLGPLPSFVRGLPRVRRWVGAKICLYHARLKARRRSV